MLKNITSDELRSVSPSAVAAWARNRGWKRESAYRDFADIYLDASGTEILIPRNDKAVDYTSVIKRLIEIFSDTTETPEHVVFKGLIDAEHDVVRLRAIDDCEDGTISIESGIALFQQAKELMLAAACSALNPQTVYRAGANKDATELVSKIRLGQTEVGSYVAPLLTPIPPALLQSSLLEDWPEFSTDPAERQMTRKLVEGLMAVQKASDNVNAGEGIESFERSVAQGVSANLCEAIAGIVAKTNEIEINVGWASTRPAPNSKSSVRFTQHDAAILTEAARVLRSKKPRPNVSLVGTVKKLKRDAEEKSGLVTFAAEVDGKSQSVTALLDQSNYNEAIRAHKDRKVVILDGDLERIGQRWAVQNPQVRVLDIDFDLDD